jgi:hypothetical protein
VSAGVHEDSTTGHYPAATVGRIFIPPLEPREPFEEVFRKIKTQSVPWLGNGRSVYISYKPRPEDVRHGRWSGVHRQIGHWLENHQNVTIIVHHEPEGGSDRLDGATFEAMFRRAREEIKTGWPGARVAYCAMAYQWREGGTAARSPEHWRRVVADQYLCDVYSGKNERNGWFAETAILPEHPGFLGWFHTIVLPRLTAGEAVDWGLGERGFMAGSDEVRAATIRREAAWLAGVFDRFAAGSPLTGYPPSLYLAWSSPGQEHEPAWVLSGHSAEAMRELTTAFARHSR